MTCAKNGSNLRKNTNRMSNLRLFKKHFAAVSLQTNNSKIRSIMRKPTIPPEHVQSMLQITQSEITQKIMPNLQSALCFTLKSK